MISQILDRLFVGDSEFLPKDLEELRITHIINVGGVKLPYRQLCFWHHLSDDGDNPEWAFSTIVGRLETALNWCYSHRVLVCCRAGMSRSVFVILLYLQKMGMSRDEAYAFIKSKHPIAQINLDLMRCA